MTTPSGKSWVSLFPNSASLADLKEPFASAAQNFIGALKAAGARVAVMSTFRPPQRAYLMHCSFEIAKKGLDPAKAPPMPGVEIDWVHKDATGAPDQAASKAAAAEMVQAYDIVFEPVLDSNHTRGLAVDMDISWTGILKIKSAAGADVTIDTAPNNGFNKELQAVGAGYGVKKLATDPPHWSFDGH